MSKFNKKYTCIDYFGDIRHIWTIVGAAGGVHIHVTECSEREKNLTDQREPYGGIEIHSRKPLNDFHDAPSHINCEVIGGPCWHDGSSMWVSENIIPHFEFPRCIQDHEMMWNHCINWYNKRFVNV